MWICGEIGERIGRRDGLSARQELENSSIDVAAALAHAGDSNMSDESIEAFNTQLNRSTSRLTPSVSTANERVSYSVSSAYVPLAVLVPLLPPG